MALISRTGARALDWVNWFVSSPPPDAKKTKRPGQRMSSSEPYPLKLIHLAPELHAPHLASPFASSPGSFFIDLRGNGGTSHSLMKR